MVCPVVPTVAVAEVAGIVVYVIKSRGSRGRRWWRSSMRMASTAGPFIAVGVAEATVPANMVLQLLLLEQYMHLNTIIENKQTKKVQIKC